MAVERVEEKCREWDSSERGRIDGWELLRRSEGLRVPSFTAGQEFQRLAYAHLIVANKDDWCGLQHLRSPHFPGQVRAFMLHGAYLTDDTPAFGRFYNDNPKEINEMRIMLYFTALSARGSFLVMSSRPV